MRQSEFQILRTVLIGAILSHLRRLVLQYGRQRKEITGTS